MVNPAWIIRAAAAVLSDEDTRKRLGWIVAAICSPLILTLALICSLLSGSAEHNNSAVLLCFHGGTIPDKTPAEYVAYIEDMRRSFTLLDDAIAAVNDMVEGDSSLDGIRVKAVFYAIFFGEDTPSRRAHRQFVDCFVTYEERTRTITDEDGTETEESYTVAIPVADIATVYGNLENTLHLEISVEQKSNADSIYSLVRYGIAGGSEGWIPGADVPFIGADGFCSPIGSGWERRVTSEFGNRVDPITGKRKGHGGMDLAVPTGTPIRAALGGTVTVSKYNAGGYGYYVMIDHGNGLATLYGHCAPSCWQKWDRRLRRETSSPCPAAPGAPPGRTSTSRRASTGNGRIQGHICRKAERKEMIMNMARYEQETIIGFNEEEKTAGIYTHNKVLRQKLEALARDRPEDCRLVKVSHSGRAVDYVIPKSWIRIVSPRIASEAQKEASRKASEKAVSARRKTPRGDN